MSDFKIKIKNFKNSLRRNGIKTELRRFKNYIKYKKTVPNEFEEWILLNEPSKKELEKQKNYNPILKTNFLILVSSEKEKAMIGEQTYENYKVIVSSPEDYMQNIKKYDSDYCIFIGDNIKLQPFCLYSIQKFVMYNYCNIIYTDNDHIKDKKRNNPEFKPHFAYDNILSKNYIGNFLAIKTKFLKENGNILVGLSHTESSYDILLRSIEKTKKIMHIDKILYHKLDEKIDTEEQKKIIKQHLDRIDTKYDSIEDGEFLGQYKINYKILNSDKISIVIPNMDHIEDLEKCINSILKSSYKNYEIVIVENNSKNKETFKYYETVQKNNNNIKVINMKINEFNYSKIVNYGVENSDGKYIVLLNNDIEIINNDWLEQMLMYVQREDVGICGARLYFDDDSIQHAGVTIGIRGLAGHRYREFKKEKFSENDNISFVQDLSAVTAACFMVRKMDYDKVLGFDEKLAVAFNDVDFCLKIRKEGKLIVYNPFVEAYHYESKSRGEDTENKEKQKRFAREYEIFVKRWSKTLAKGDRYFNINYRLDTDIPKINYNKIIHQEVN